MICTIEHETDDDLLEKLAGILRQKGFLVFYSPKMETPKEVSSRMGLKPPLLTKRLKSFRSQFPARTGPSGRILNLHVTPELEKHLKPDPRRSGRNQ